MSTETEKLPIYIEGPQIQTRLEDVAAAFRRLAMLRLAEAELPALIAAAQAEADAACLALGLSGDHRDVGGRGTPAVASSDFAPSDEGPECEPPPRDAAAILIRNFQSTNESAGVRASAEAGSGHPVEVVEPEGGAPIAPGSPLTQDESAGDRTPEEAEAHTPAEGAVEAEGGSVPPSASPLTRPAVAPERRGGRPLGDVSQACLRVLELAHPHAATAADIVTASGYSLDKVRGRLYALSSAGRIVRDDSKGEPLWTLAIDEPPPVVSAALAAAGEVAP